MRNTATKTSSGTESLMSHLPTADCTICSSTASTASAAAAAASAAAVAGSDSMYACTRVSSGAGGHGGG
eukprot:CAMPEP_0205943016 /NCGR_PEP_ID=MMETSP1325-20131115/59251_1 /ASSEMBLY_ACC=CAM_ASM_000708 /TAXON_ID=236786 /ORGANISM="Florenciella sp., Strain RCC1007" /LENGTH=68 /DNA_ID=CAMNT_0053313795 /DNA_START=58 /DNA_END=264 /DNA_ORIENTATION=-